MDLLKHSPPAESRFASYTLLGVLMELLPYIVKDLMFQWSARCGDWHLSSMALAVKSLHLCFKTVGDNMASQSWDAKCIQRGFDWTCFWIGSSHTMDHCYVLHFSSSSILAGWNHTGFSSRHLRLQPLGLIRSFTKTILLVSPAAFRFRACSKSACAAGSCIG